MLSLLRPGGRMVVVLDEEAVLVTRGHGSSGASASGTQAASSSAPLNQHDFSRETVAGMLPPAAPAAGGSGGDLFGALEDPTPWEVQAAIKRVRERERQKGQEQVRRKGQEQVSCHACMHACLRVFEMELVESRCCHWPNVPMSCMYSEQRL